MKPKEVVILVVEDSLLVIDRIVGMLSEIKNIKHILHASNYADSLKLIREANASIVLLDINLPDKSGIELLQEIKTNHPQLKVMMLSNYASDDYRDLCTNMGADYFFDKSNDFEKIPAAINELY
jgi:DNA-binding NarL/FixJ family response regulator